MATEVELFASLAIAGRMRGLHGGQGQPTRVWSDVVAGQGPTRLATNADQAPKYVRVTLDPTLVSGVGATGKVSFHTAGNTGKSGEYHDLLVGEVRYECILQAKESLWCYGRWGGMVPLFINVFVMEVSP